jgi:hypothetical protein
LTTFQYPIRETLGFPIVAKKKKRTAQNVVKGLRGLKSRKFTKESCLYLLHKLYIFTGF